tara:strand:- start:9712 stop:10287 length:576 start_codon:yes stop_codon:yes gene_type:complete
MTDTEPKHPGKILFDQVMTPLGVSRNKLARDIDVPVGRISDIVAGKRGVTPDTALRFAKYFGTTAELWLRLQADFDLYVARTSSWREAEPKVAVYEPVAGAAPPTPAPPPAAPDYPPAVQAGDPVPGDSTPKESPAGADAPDTAETVPVDAGNDLIDAIEPQDNPSSDHPDDEDIDIPEPVSAGVNRSGGF